jgi:hypothetical protein
MEDAYETPFDRYETPYDASEGSVADLDTRLDPMGTRLDMIDATLDQMKARLDRIEATLDRMDTRLDKVVTNRQVLFGGILLTLEITALSLIGMCWRRQRTVTKHQATRRACGRGRVAVTQRTDPPLV